MLAGGSQREIGERDDDDEMWKEVVELLCWLVLVGSRLGSQHTSTMYEKKFHTLNITAPSPLAKVQPNVIKQIFLKRFKIAYDKPPPQNKCRECYADWPIFSICID